MESDSHVHQIHEGHPGSGDDIRPHQLSPSNYDKELYDSGNYSENGTLTLTAIGSDLGDISPVNQLPNTPDRAPILTIGSPSISRQRSSPRERCSDDETSQSSFNSSLPASSTPNKVLSNVSSPGPPMTPYLQNLLDNFNCLYEQKLQEAESDGALEGSYSLEVKNSIMSDWVRDLNEQNKVLIETVDEMEKEAEEKIQLLQSKVQKSAQMLVDHMTIIQEYEKQVQSFIHHRDETERHLQAFYAEADELMKKKNSLEEKLEAVELEHSCLIKLITRIRDWGVWDLTGLDFEAKTYKQLFDLYPGLPGSEVQTVFTQERAREVKDNETKLHDLEIKFAALQKQQASTQKLNIEKESLILDLQKERMELHLKIASLESENRDYHRRLEESHELFTKSFLNSCNANASNRELDELLHDLKELKDELHIARTERHSAKMEASALKAEMNQRLSDVTQLKTLLQDLYADSEITKDKVQTLLEKQDKLASVQEELKFFQDQYKEANQLLESNSQTVLQLHEKLDLLYEKVTDLEASEHPPSSFSHNRPKAPPFSRIPSHASVPRNNQSRREATSASHTATDDKPLSGRRPTSEHQVLPKINYKPYLRKVPEKPTWNDHFYSKKSTNVNLPPPSKFQTNAVNSPRPRIRTGTPYPVKEQVTDSRTSKKEDKPASSGKNHGDRVVQQKLPPIESNSARSTKIAKYFSDRFGIMLEDERKSKSHEQRSAAKKSESENVKLPHISAPALLAAGSQNTLIHPEGTHSKHEAKASTDACHLPRIFEREATGGDLKTTPPISGRSKGTVQGSTSKTSKRSEYQELGNLLDSALESSRSLIAEHPEVRTVRVRATRHHRAHGGGDPVPVSIGADDGSRQNVPSPRRETSNSNHVETFGSLMGLEGSFGRSVPLTQGKSQEFRPVAQTGTVQDSSQWVSYPDAILASLPEQIPEFVIQNWIIESKKNCSKTLKLTSDSAGHLGKPFEKKSSRRSKRLEKRSSVA